MVAPKLLRQDPQVWSDPFILRRSKKSAASGRRRALELTPTASLAEFFDFRRKREKVLKQEI